MEKKLQFRTEDFEGPLDLLLALVAKNKMSIYDIEITTLIDQYLEIVGEPGPEGLDDASEFIAMAARLVQMKSMMLLPRSDEADRMREELTGLLVEYSACKQVAAQLREMAAGVYIMARKPAFVQLDAEYKGAHMPEELAAAWAALQGRATARRAPRAERFDEIVTAPFVSVTGRVIYLLRGLKNGIFSSLIQPFRACTTRSETVATFLALLELVRGGRIYIEDSEALRLRTGAERDAGRAVRRAGKAVADGTE